MFVRSLEGSGHGGMKGGEEERRARSQREERRVIHVIYTVAASISHARRHLEEGKRGGGRVCQETMFGLAIRDSNLG